VTEKAEANLEHLIDLNPYTPRLAEHLELLRATRADGIEAAYEAHAQRRLLARQIGFSEHGSTRRAGSPGPGHSRMIVELY